MKIEANTLKLGLFSGLEGGDAARGNSLKCNPSRAIHRDLSTFDALKTFQQ